MVLAFITYSHACFFSSSLSLVLSLSLCECVPTSPSPFVLWLMLALFSCRRTRDHAPRIAKIDTRHKNGVFCTEYLVLNLFKYSVCLSAQYAQKPSCLLLLQLVQCIVALVTVVGGGVGAAVICWMAHFYIHNVCAFGFQREHHITYILYTHFYLYKVDPKRQIFVTQECIFAFVSRSGHTTHAETNTQFSIQSARVVKCTKKKKLSVHQTRQPDRQIVILKIRNFMFITRAPHEHAHTQITTETLCVALITG